MKSDFGDVTGEGRRRDVGRNTMRRSVMRVTAEWFRLKTWRRLKTSLVLEWKKVALGGM